MKLSRFTITALFLNLTLFSFAYGNTDSMPRDSRSGGGPGQEMPMPSDSELTLLRLQSFAENTENSLALSEEQAETIIPILV